MPAPLPPGPDACGTTETRLDEQVHPIPNTTSSEHTTLPGDGNEDFGTGKESSQDFDCNGLVRTQSACVDVARAEEEFAQLNRQFSAYSERSRRLSTQQSRKYSKVKVGDVEKAVSADDSSEEPWDLETTLRGAKAADREAGIKTKRIGASNRSSWVLLYWLC
jgi:hypothetical protein